MALNINCRYQSYLDSGGTLAFLQWEVEDKLRQAFVSMDAEVSRFRPSWGQGHAMHDAARAVAPEWLRRWDDDKRWIICFTQGYRGLVNMAEAFGLSKDELLTSIRTYADKLAFLDWFEK